MCIVTGPNIERKLGLIFQDKETLIQLNGCTIETYPSNHCRRIEH